MNNQKLYLSYSSIKTYLKCKQKFKYKYIDKVNACESISNKYMSFGNSMHKALADFNQITNPNYRTIDILHNLLRKNWIRDGYESIEEERNFGKKGLEMLTKYYESPKDIGLKNLIIEEMIYKDMEKYVLCGKLDKVYLRKDKKIEVIDYKTGKPSLIIDKIQLPLYIILAEAKLNYYPNIISTYFLSTNQKLSKDLDDKFIEKAIKYVLNICEKICNESNFEPKPDFYCENYCEYFSICDEAKNRNLTILNKLERENALIDIF